MSAYHNVELVAPRTGIGIANLKGAGTRFIVAAGDTTSAPSGTTVLHAPGKQLLVAGRTFVNNDADLPTALALARQITVRPYAGPWRAIGMVVRGRRRGILGSRQHSASRAQVVTLDSRRQRDSHRCPFSFAALEVDGSPVSLDDAPGERQPKADAACLAPTTPVSPKEGGEHVRHFVGVDALTMIPNVDDSRAIHDAEPDLNRLPGLRVLVRIVQHVRQRMLEHHAVDGDCRVCRELPRVCLNVSGAERRASGR